MVSTRAGAVMQTLSKRGSEINMPNDETISAEAILEQLERLLKSSVFSPSERLSRFLRYTIQKTMDGNFDQLKEYTIGAEVYDRKPPYDPGQNSIVRVEAQRLRAKLKVYYEGEGRQDPIQIYYCLGSYVPTFRLRNAPQSRICNTSVEPSDSVRLVKVAVLPFTDNSATTLSAAIAQGITDELVLRLMQTEGCKVVAASFRQQQQEVLSPDIPSLAARLGVEVVIRGTVRKQHNHVRVTFELVNASGLLWSQKLEGTLDPDNIFELEEQMASALLSRVGPQSSAERRTRYESWEAVLLHTPEVLAADALLDQGESLATTNALRRFQNISKHVPDSARVWSGITQCHYWCALSGASFMSDHVTAAEKAAMQALKSDRRSAASHAAYGCALAMRCDWPGAEDSFRQAISLGLYTPAYRLLGDLLTSLSRFEEAAQFLEFAQKIDPFSYLQKASYSRFLYTSRRFDQASGFCLQPSKYGTLPVVTLLYGAHSCIQLRMYEEVLCIAAQLEMRARGSIVALAEIAEILALSGDATRARSIVRTHDLLVETAPLSMVRKGLLSLALGDFGDAKSYLCRAGEQNELEHYWLRADPRFDSIRNDSYFSKLMRTA